VAWTTPRTWVTGEIVTATIMNTHVRDNFNAVLGIVNLTQHFQAQFGAQTITTAAGWNSTTITIPTAWTNTMMAVVETVGNTTGANVISHSARITGNGTFALEWNLASAVGTTTVNWISIGY
jgi:hypothetical protein